MFPWKLGDIFLWKLDLLIFIDFGSGDGSGDGLDGEGKFVLEE